MPATPDLSVGVWLPTLVVEVPQKVGAHWPQGPVGGLLARIGSVTLFLRLLSSNAPASERGK